MQAGLALPSAAGVHQGERTLTRGGLDGLGACGQDRHSDPRGEKPLTFASCLSSSEHSGLTTGVAFGHHAKFIASTGMDRSLKFYSL